MPGKNPARRRVRPPVPDSGPSPRRVGYCGQPAGGRGLDEPGIHRTAGSRSKAPSDVLSNIEEKALRRGFPWCRQAARVGALDINPAVAD